MILKLKNSIVIFHLILIVTSCQHELNFPPGQMGGTGVFSYYGSPDTCTYSNIAGSYKTGTPLASINQVTIGVDVTSVGTYNISTPLINGFKFSGSGTFSATGLQTILLTGGGTPVSPGIFLYSTGLNGCSFPVSVVDGGISGTAVFTYNGAPTGCTNLTVGGNYTASKALNGFNRIRIDVSVFKAGNYNIQTETINGISFSGSGNLPTPGYGVVDLFGKGTPTNEGVFRYVPSNNGCTFGVRVFPKSTSAGHLSFTMDGTDITLDNFTISSHGDSIFISAFEGASPGDRGLDILLVKSPAIATGTYDQHSLTNTENFCRAVYTDKAASSEWHTGQVDQAGKFSVNVSKYTTIEIEGTFSGSLYGENGNGSDAKVITNGHFSLPF
jgi:hypothetical protein